MMMGRISHYFKKARLKLQADGVWGVLRVFGEFAWRRRFGAQFLFESFEYHFLSRFHDVSATLLGTFEVRPMRSKRVLIYASFDPESRLQSHVLEQISFFQASGYDIFFVTTSPQVSSEDLERLSEYCCVVLHRENIGYDFASYRAGFDLIRHREGDIESLVIMNDSCAGPFFDFTPMLEKMRQAVDSVYGLSKSLEISEHIQSYFYHFGAGVISRGVARKFFDRIRILHTKWAIVRYLEIGSSAFLKRKGVAIPALVDPASPDVEALLAKYALTEPTREPLASHWVKTQMNPFSKRSNHPKGKI